MSKIARIDLQIQDIDDKIQRLKLQKELLVAKKQRIEIHSKRVTVLQEDREKDKAPNSATISSDPRVRD